MYRLVPWEFARPARLVAPNFTIIVDDDKRYPCHLILAAAYCTEVLAHLRVDPRAAELKIDLPDPCNQFPLVISLLNGEQIEFNESNLFFLCVAATTLGISSLLNETRHQMKTNDVVSVDYEDSDQFNGIVMYLADIEKFDVTVSASSSSSYGFPANVISRQCDIFFWESNDRPNQYLVFDFGRFPVNLAAYVIRSADNVSDLRHPKSWLVLGSDDEENWESVDQKDNVPYLTNRSVSVAFQVAEPSEHFYRYLKIIMTDANFRGDWIFRFSQIEFFGGIRA
jgi:hypothetical protein